jgi:hypothetical protein
MTGGIYRMCSPHVECVFFMHVCASPNIQYSQLLDNRCSRAHICTHMHVPIYARTCPHMHTHIHVYTCTHTLSLIHTHRLVHLTNAAVQKKHPTYKNKSEDSILSLSALQQALEEDGSVPASNSQKSSVYSDFI